MKIFKVTFQTRDTDDAGYEDKNFDVTESRRVAAKDAQGAIETVKAWALKRHGAYLDDETDKKIKWRCIDFRLLEVEMIATTDDED